MMKLLITMAMSLDDDLTVDCGHIGCPEARQGSSSATRQRPDTLSGRSRTSSVRMEGDLHGEALTGNYFDSPGSFSGVIDKESTCTLFLS